MSSGLDNYCEEYDRSSDSSKYHWKENPNGSLTCENCGVSLPLDFKDQLYFLSLLWSNFKGVKNDKSTMSLYRMCP